VGFRSLRDILGTIVIVATVVGVFFVPKQFFFPACLAYVLYGLGETVLIGLLGRRAITEVNEAAEDEEDDMGAADRSAGTLAYAPSDAITARRRRRRRRPRRDRHDRDIGDDKAPPSQED